MAVRDHNGRSDAVEHAEDLRERSTGELVGHLAQETGRLMRQELRYAKAEMTIRLERSRNGAAMLGAAAITGLLALGALTATLIAALDEAMPTWLAALIVTFVWSAIAAAVAMRGRELLRRAGAPVPENAIHELKEDVEWLRQRTRS